MTGSPRFSHLDDLEFQEVRRVGQGDRTMSVREKWLDFSPAYLSLYAQWDPGMIVQPHGHNSNHVIFVLEGEMTCGDMVCRKGGHIALDQGDTFGPFVAGPEGVELFEVMMGDPRSFPADPEGYERFLAARGARQLPNPPIDMPDWIEDTPELNAPPAPPFAAGSVSFRSYPNEGLTPADMITELRAQAALAVEHGFDGVMTSEHHGGFAGYLPNPLQLAGFLLDAMPRGWAAPCPLLLPLRPAALVAEETAWLAARFPGRVGVGLAAGALAVDFEIMDVPMGDLTARFGAGLELVTGALRGDAAGPLAADAALAQCREHPIPVVSAAASMTAARRAARVGAGLLFDSLVTPERVRELVDVYRSAGGTGSCVLVRRAWVGEPPRAAVDRQVDVYRGYAPERAPAHWGVDEMIVAPGAAEVAQHLLDAQRVAGADALNLRVHVPGVDAAAAREQIAILGAEVVPRVRGAA